MNRFQTQMVVAFFLLIAFACNEEKKEPQHNDPLPKLPDSLVTRHPEASPNTYASVDISPMDMAYFPVDYPKLKMANIKMPPPVMRLIYSRPQLARRPLFNKIIKYGEPWRLGANEASEIQFFRAVNIQGKKINPGRYTIYAIPQPEMWTIILNSNIDTWGLKQDPTKDVARFEIPVSTNGTSLEYFTMVFEKAEDGAHLVIAWADVLAKLPIEF